MRGEELLDPRLAPPALSQEKDRDDGKGKHGHRSEQAQYEGKVGRA